MTEMLQRVPTNTMQQVAQNGNATYESSGSKRYSINLQTTEGVTDRQKRQSATHRGCQFNLS